MALVGMGQGSGVSRPGEVDRVSLPLNEIRVGSVSSPLLMDEASSWSQGEGAALNVTILFLKMKIKLSLYNFEKKYIYPINGK